jgi:Fe-Mn family superoxide dismutase
MFKLPDLPFEMSALAPHMSADTLAVHHGKHHAGYIKKTNDALKERSGAPKTLEAVVRLAAGEKDKKLFNNAAQAWNHGFFWQCLTSETQTPEGNLKRAIETAFGDVTAFGEEAKTRGENHFASGWLWLVADEKGAVKLMDLHDADTPLVDETVTPLLVCDLWEHAYYLDYKNERAKFLDAFLNQLANWRFAEAQYEAAQTGRHIWAFPS